MKWYELPPVYLILAIQLLISSFLYAIKPLVLPYLDIEDEIKFMSMCESPWILVGKPEMIPTQIRQRMVMIGWFVIVMMIWSVFSNGL